jgi:hypothetical protein
MPNFIESVNVNELNVTCPARWVIDDKTSLFSLVMPRHQGFRRKKPFVAQAAGLSTRRPGFDSGAVHILILPLKRESRN